MDFTEVVQERYSCRSYQPKPVEEEKLLRVFEAARLAPSASNRQEWRFVVVTDPDTRAKLVEVCRGQRFVGEAPVVIAGCAKTDEHVMSCGVRCDVVDVSIAMEHIALAATNEGLGTCWIGAFLQEPARELLGIPEGVFVVDMMTLGYPADSAGPKTRLALEEILMRERYTE